MKIGKTFAIVLLGIMVPLSGLCIQSPETTITISQKESFGEISTSRDDNWIAYQVQYGVSGDTLFLKSLKTGEELAFSGKSTVKFDLNSNWALISSPQELGQLLNLHNLRISAVPASTMAVFLNDYNALILWSTSQKQLIWYDLDSQQEFMIEGISQVWENPGTGRVLVEREGGLFLLNGKDVDSWTKLFQEESNSYAHPVWSRDGNDLAIYVQSPRDTVLYHMDIEKTTLVKLDLSINRENYDLSTQQWVGRSLHITEDGDWILVPVQEKRANNIEPIVEQWRSDTPFLYPKMNSQMAKPLYGAWHPGKNQFYLLSENHFDNLIPIRNTHKVLIYDESLYQSDYVNHPKTDFRIFDLDNRKEELFLEEMEVGIYFIKVSPNSDQIAYFRKGNWWVYDLVNGNKINLTKNIDATWADLSRYGKDTVPYNKPFWLSDGRTILLQDEYDLWKVDLNDLSYEQMTHGREQGVFYKLGQYTHFDKNTFRQFHGSPIDLDEGIAIKMRNLKEDTGYVEINERGLKQILNLQPNYFRRFEKSSYGYFWIQERFNVPSQLWYKKNGMKKPRMIKALNPKYRKEEHGKAELMSYSNSHGDTLQGVIFYPPDFDSEQRYPMVVHIYENQSYLLHHFEMPGYHNPIGFNVANLLKKGYLVFLPEINYRLGSPGPSALDNVESGIRALISKGIVRPESIGLYGHSFGAFEVAYIMTHSKLFSTYVLGSGVYDIIRQYLTFSRAYGQKPELWRYETQQYRMGGSLYENFQNYLDNSPIYQLDSLNVPIFLWTGKQDRNVTWKQSLTLHIALRRLNKTHKFIVFPAEGHILNGIEAKKYLTMEMEFWMDKYLK